MRKGQAALEFLTTYGWAFIIILASIGAMTYFGIIDPKILLTERCIFGAEFECRDYRLGLVDGGAENGRNVADFILVNSVGDQIDVAGIKATYPNGLERDCIKVPFPPELTS